jgi:TRAP-type transport system small permease protein
MRWALAHLEDVIGGFLLLVVLVIVALGVFFRYVLVAPLQWADEIAMAVFIWQVFIGAAAASRRGMHVAIDTLVVALPPAAQWTLRILSYLLVIAVLVSLIVYGWQFANSTWNQYTLNLRIPRFWVNLSLPVGAALMLWRTLEHLRDALAGRADDAAAVGLDAL